MHQTRQLESTLRLAANDSSGKTFHPILVTNLHSSVVGHLNEKVSDYFGVFVGLRQTNIFSRVHNSCPSVLLYLDHGRAQQKQLHEQEEPDLLQHEHAQKSSGWQWRLPSSSSSPLLSFWSPPVSSVGSPQSPSSSSPPPPCFLSACLEVAAAAAVRLTASSFSSSTSCLTTTAAEAAIRQAIFCPCYPPCLPPPPLPPTISTTPIRRESVDGCVCVHRR